MLSCGAGVSDVLHPEETITMAYIKNIDHPCRYSSYCPSRATKELFNIRNASHGFFCSMHAKIELKRLLREEKL